MLEHSNYYSRKAGRTKDGNEILAGKKQKDFQSLRKSFETLRVDPNYHFVGKLKNIM